MTRSQWDGVLDWLVQHLASHHPNLHHSISREAWDGKVEDLQSRLPSLNDHRAQTELMSLVASIGDAHTILHWEPSEVYPLRFYWFSDGLFVIKAQDKYGHLLNSRVLAINALSMDQLVDAVKKVIPHENESRLRGEFPHYLIHPGMLYGLGITHTPQEMQLTCVTGDGLVQTWRVQAEPNLKRDWRDAQEPMPPQKETNAPLYLRGKEQYYWFTHLPNHETVYFRYHRCGEHPAYPMAAFLDQLFQSVRENGTKRLVVDLRQNRGGSSRVLAPFIPRFAALDGINQQGRLYVLVGRETFSSALMNALQFRKYTKAIFVGEPTGGKPNSFGETVTMELPGTDLALTHSTKYFRQSEVDSDSFVPDFVVELSHGDYAAGVDPVWDYVLSDSRRIQWRF